jgi:GNAT superfamily N-acetyltransferase
VDDARGVATVHVATWQAAYRGLIDQEVLDALRVEQRADGWSRWIAAAPSSTPPDGARRDQHRLLVAESDDRIVGWASFGAGRDPGMAHLGELAGLYVHPDSWSHGVGHALFSRVEDELLAAGWDDGYLWVLGGNDRAIAFYEQHGWHADGAEKFGEAGGARELHELRHVRRLSSAR